MAAPGGLQIYELLGMAGEFGGAPDWVESYEAGLAAWRARDFTAAIAAFEKVLAIRTDDAASSAMIERCKQQLENPGSRGLGRHYGGADEVAGRCAGSRRVLLREASVWS